MDMTYLLVGECLGAINDCDVLVLVDWVVLLLNGRCLVLHHFVLASVGVDPRDEETTPVVLHVVHVVVLTLLATVTSVILLLLLIAVSLVLAGAGAASIVLW